MTTGDISLAPIIRPMHVLVHRCPFCGVDCPTETRWDDHWPRCPENDRERLGCEVAADG